MISWYSYIQNTKPDDGEAFDYFFELLDMYIEEKLVTKVYFMTFTVTSLRSVLGFCPNC
jgi:hypothetical protein